MESLQLLELPVIFCFVNLILTHFLRQKEPLKGPQPHSPIFPLKILQILFFGETIGQIVYLFNMST